MVHRPEEERPAVVERRSRGGAGWFIAGALLIVIVGAIWLYNEGILSGGDVDVDVTAPTVNNGAPADTTPPAADATPPATEPAPATETPPAQ
ncbi:hypothetical protein [Microbaculum marinum]|uniref:Uncharacterized protein n=1 Tax=Microbaculum marinum TaxID=1764581 RepID=A0AAW9RME9_9HYPH